ncbi:MAG: site-specific DNA-methyltransferase [Phycisphaerae bacterium]|jgi:adenine-specific DNA-methyltransferase
MATGIPLANGRAKQSHKKANGTNGHQPSIDITLSYEGKQSERAILGTSPAQFERVTTEGACGEARNRFYSAENLSALAALRNDPAVCGKVRLVYIDPPYATKSVFQSRQQNDAYSDLLEGAHYIEFLRARLIFLRELLADDGSIYVHLDDNMAFHAKAIMDEIFGAANFRNWITRRKCNPKNYTRKTFGNVSDYILFYSKTDEYVWHRPVEAWTPQRADKEYQYTDAKTNRRYKKVPVHAPGVRNGETGQLWHGMMPPPGKHWQYRPGTLDEMDARGEIYWSPTGNPRRKVFLDESDGIPVQDIWLDFRDAHNQNIHITGYPTEKNPALLKQIIEASSNEGDLVLDCFAGSGTTLEVAHRLNRRWIGIDNSPESRRVILQRFARGLEPMGDFVKKEQSGDDELDLFQGAAEKGASLNGNGDHAPIREFEMWQSLC